MDESVTIEKRGEPGEVVALSRRVRFSIPFAPDAPDGGGTSNSFAGSPSLNELAAYYEIDVRCDGPVAPTTGWLVDIGRIDQAVRRVAIPLIRRAMRERPGVAPGHLLPNLLARLGEAVGAPIRSLTWQLTPFYSLTMEREAMDEVLIRQQFSFAASHRLHAPGLDDEANRRTYGKCNNPNGHGHNYKIEVAAAVPLPAGDASGFGLVELERVVDEQVIERFDHTHLNRDTSEFAELIPSVEHIAKVSYDLLAEPLEQAGARLDHVTVWETEKTCCTYPVRGA